MIKRTTPVLLLLALGCEVPPEDIHQFSDSDALLNWIAGVAETEPLPSARVARQDGRVTGVTIDDPADRAVLAGLLGSEQGRFSVAGQIQTTDFMRPGAGTRAASDEARKAIGAVASTTGFNSDQTVCSGVFCSRNSSWNSHFGIFGITYHDVGGDTGVGPDGGYREIKYDPVVLPGCNPYSRLPCPRGCNPGDIWVEGTRAGPGYCLHREGWNNLWIQNTYFAGNRVAIETSQNAASNVAALGLSKTAFGAKVAPCFPGGPLECVINGVCTRHRATGPGGETIVTTAAGSYDCF